MKGVFKVGDHVNWNSEAGSCRSRPSFARTKPSPEKEGMKRGIVPIYQRQ
jgi:hypothetical protein